VRELLPANRWIEIKGPARFIQDRIFSTWQRLLKLVTMVTAHF